MVKIRQTALIYLKGLGMGGADVIPGVSGGTIAFITGIYEQLLDSIKEVDIAALKLLFTLQLKPFWTKINGSFLLPLFLGILTSLLTLAKIMTYLLQHHGIAVWSFFFGLIIISSIVVLRVVKRWSWLPVVTVFIGIIIAYLITDATPAETPTGLWFIFISGAIAICAMILPGISGSFLLLIMGKYEYILNALNQLDWTTIITFAVGCLTGLLSFVRLISWLLKKYHDLSVALLSGFMLGSLNKVWPWKIATAFRINSSGERVPYLTKNIFPWDYLGETGTDPQFLQALLFMAIGFMLVVLIEKVANMKSHKV